MMDVAAAALLSAVTILVAWVVYLYTLPWLMRLRCVYALHSIRDRVFKVGLTYPRLRHTLFYRDIDSVIASSIQMVRDGGVAEALMFMSMMAPQNHQKQQTSPGWRVDQLKFELRTVFVGADGKIAVEELRACAKETEKVVFHRAFTGHPTVFFGAIIATLVAVPVALCGVLLKRLRPQKASRKDAQGGTTASAEAHTLSDVISGFEKPTPLELPKLRAPRLFYDRIARRGRLVADHSKLVHGP